MQTRSRNTRERILDAAYRLFSQQGYDAASVAEICSAAGVSKGAFYHHFLSKQAVFLALMESWFERLDASFASALQGAPNVAQAVVRMADLAGSVFQSADVRLSILLEFWLQASRDAELWKAAVQPYHRYQQYFVDLIQAGIQDGSLRPVNPEQAARAMVSLAMGLLMQAIFAPQSADWSQEPRQSVQILMEGLARRVG